MPEPSALRGRDCASDPARRDAPPCPLPLSADWLAELRDAAVTAAALMAGAASEASFHVRSTHAPASHAPAAARMRLLVALRRSGLLDGSPHPDPLPAFQDLLVRFRDPAVRRQVVARAMNRFVGTPWAGMILDVAEAVATPEAPATPRRLAALRIALGLPGAGERPGQA